MVNIKTGTNVSARMSSAIKSLSKSSHTDIAMFNIEDILFEAATRFQNAEFEINLISQFLGNLKQNLDTSVKH